MCLKKILRKDYKVITQNSNLAQASQLMKDYHVGALIVVESLGQGPVRTCGMVTARDLALSLGKVRANLDKDVLVRDVMSKYLVEAREGDSVEEVIQKMRVHGVHRIPVINEEGHLSGLVNSEDIIALLARELGELSNVMSESEETKRERVHNHHYTLTDNHEFKNSLRTGLAGKA